MPGNKVVLALDPQASAEQQPDGPHPTPEVVIQQIADGTVHFHPSKATITARRIQMQICNIQRGFQLVIGANGGWNADAHSKLLQWLMKSEHKRQRTSPSPCPALEDQKQQKQLALEDQPASSHSPALSHPPAPEASISEGVAKAFDDVDKEQALVNQSDRATHDNEKSVDPSSSSSSSSSASSAARKLRNSPAKVREAQVVLQHILPIVSNACIDCANFLKYLQGLLDKAMGSQRYLHEEIHCQLHVPINQHTCRPCRFLSVFCLNVLAGVLAQIHDIYVACPVSSKHDVWYKKAA